MLRRDRQPRSKSPIPAPAVGGHGSKASRPKGASWSKESLSKTGWQGNAPRQPAVATATKCRDRRVLRERARLPALEATMAGQPHGAPRRPSATRLSLGVALLVARRQATVPLSAASRPSLKTADPLGRRPLSSSLGETLGPSIGPLQDRPQGRDGPGMLTWTWRWSCHSVYALRSENPRCCDCTLRSRRS